MNHLPGRLAGTIIHLPAPATCSFTTSPSLPTTEGSPEDLHQQVNILTSNGNFEQRRRHCVLLPQSSEKEEAEDAIEAAGLATDGEGDEREEL
jgi:hypothetical protein